LPAQPTTDQDLAASHRMRRDFIALSVDQTVAEALERLRESQGGDGVAYFYVVDGEGRLRGVAPARRLLLGARDVLVSEVMVPEPAVVQESADHREVRALFLKRRLLALPVVDAEGRLQGVVDVERYSEELERPDDRKAVDRLSEPFIRFMHVEAAGGLALLAATVIALTLANSPWEAWYHSFWETSVGIVLGGFEHVEPLKHWVDDGLMTLFFFAVGLEIKRELVFGELSDPRKALLPIIAALGGMLVPAGFYMLGVHGGPGWEGWGVPMATDIAFVVGVMALLGPRMPNGLKVLLLTLAVADDMGAVLVIAVAYSGPLGLVALAWAAAGLGLVVLMRFAGIQSFAVYTVVGAGVWYAVLNSGVHPTVAGVILGLLTPTIPMTRRGLLRDALADLRDRLRGAREGSPRPGLDAASPAERLETALHPWVAFAIMPIFALANAGVRVDPSALTTPVAMAVAAGLVLGKPIGIVLFSWLSVRAGVTRLPAGVDWRAMIGAGCLGGIGFTMSLFIAGLALQSDLLDDAKIGILVGSTISAILGCAILIAALPSRPGSNPNEATGATA